jgi:hypothetical protein
VHDVSASVGHVCLIGNYKPTKQQSNYSVKAYRSEIHLLQFGTAETARGCTIFCRDGLAQSTGGEGDLRNLAIISTTTWSRPSRPRSDSTLARNEGVSFVTYAMFIRRAAGCPSRHSAEDEDAEASQADSLKSCMRKSVNKSSRRPNGETHQEPTDTETVAAGYLAIARMGSIGETVDVGQAESLDSTARTGSVQTLPHKAAKFRIIDELQVLAIPFKDIG